MRKGTVRYQNIRLRTCSSSACFLPYRKFRAAQTCASCPAVLCIPISQTKHWFFNICKLLELFVMSATAVAWRSWSPTFREPCLHCVCVISHLDLPRPHVVQVDPIKFSLRGFNYAILIFIFFIFFKIPSPKKPLIVQVLGVVDMCQYYSLWIYLIVAPVRADPQLLQFPSPLFYLLLLFL